MFLGITISSLFKRREDSIVFLVLLSIPSLMLSGLSFPIEGFSEFYQFISKLIPSTPGINGFVRLTQMEASFLEVMNEWNHLWILTGIYFIFAAISLKMRAFRESNHLKLSVRKGSDGKLVGKVILDPEQSEVIDDDGEYIAGEVEK